MLHVGATWFDVFLFEYVGIERGAVIGIQVMLSVSVCVVS